MQQQQWVVINAATGEERITWAEMAEDALTATAGIVSTVNIGKNTYHCGAWFVYHDEVMNAIRLNRFQERMMG